MTCQTFVKAGVTLRIQAGTTIFVTPADADGLAPALVIERGAKIVARGTAEEPVTFTSVSEAQSDDQALVDTSRGGNGTVVLGQRGKWGGVIVCGFAPVHPGAVNGVRPTEVQVEGLANVYYGGNDTRDDSGALEYVRIWYAGAVIGADNEINGLTLAGVGNGTFVSHVEVAYCLDDGFEFFGGTVNVRYLSSIFNGDDAFDVDQGYHGKGQFLFAVLGDQGDHGLEIDSQVGGCGRGLPGRSPFAGRPTTDSWASVE